MNELQGILNFIHFEDGPVINKSRVSHAYSCLHQDQIANEQSKLGNILLKGIVSVFTMNTLYKIFADGIV